ncbi:gamma-secretase subunit APH-1A-like isoform X1 [Anguilla rostrata]|uniref:gamma-secretase subunit APH-1A-like isoform X1 n=1 Tax=Anguilla rostrata TaxID=7938 RepID=UPI0030CD56F7
MGLAVFFGCSFITFGPAFALLMFTVTDSPVRVIILVVGASLWLVGLVLSSLMWYALVSLCGGSDPNLQLQLLAAVAAVAVFIQEALRAASYKLLRFFSHETTHAALASFVVKGGPTLSLQQKAFVSGLAFGLMSSAFSFANILSVSLGPGIVGIHGESSHFFITSAFQAMMQSGLQVCWSVLLFSACERRSWARGVAVVLSHLLSCGLPAAAECPAGCRGDVVLGGGWRAWVSMFAAHWRPAFNEGGSGTVFCPKESCGTLMQYPSLPEPQLGQH